MENLIKVLYGGLLGISWNFNSTRNVWWMKFFGSISCRRTAKISKCLNLGSYNYLGFAAADEFCTPRVIESLKRFSPSTCSTRVDGGTFSFLPFFLKVVVFINMGIH